MGNNRIVGLLVALTVMQATLVWADSFCSKSVVYEDATFICLFDGKVQFELVTGAKVTKPLKEIEWLKIKNFEFLNKAEKLLMEKQLDLAMEAYQAGAKDAKNKVEKELIAARMAVADTAPKTTTPAQPSTCLLCKGSNQVKCHDCKGSGDGKCPSCRNGSVTCKQCQGKGRRVCSYCTGSGRTYSGSCTNCNGSGKRPCSACGTGKYVGFVACQICNGAGTKGRCPTCRGTKKVDCSQCRKQQANPPAADGSGSHLPPDASAPKRLSDTPDAVLEAVTAVEAEDTDEWQKMTSLQRTAAREKRLKDAKELENDFIGKQVIWDLSVNDVQEVPQENRLTISATSAGGCVISGSVSAAQKDLLVSVKKGDPILLKGVIEGFTRSERILFDTRKTNVGIRLKNCEVVSSAEASSQPATGKE